MPHVPQDVLDRIQALEREVRQLRGRAEMRPAMNQITAGTVTIGEGGSLDVRAPNGAQVLGVGMFSTGRYGVSMAREDGTGVAFEVGGNAAQLEQMVRLFPRGSYPTQPMVMDDAYADGYLGRPWVPAPMATRFEFTHGSWETTHAGRLRAQHAVIITDFSVYAPAGTTAEARVRINKGGALSQLGPTITATGEEAYAYERIPRSAHGLAYGDEASLLLETRRTAGTGTCVAWCFGMWGTNTATPDEA